MSEHVCDPTAPVCACGRRWPYRIRSLVDAADVRYCDAELVWKYRALYGEPVAHAFEPTETA